MPMVWLGLVKQELMEVAMMEEGQAWMAVLMLEEGVVQMVKEVPPSSSCLLYTSDAADE